MSKGDDGKEKVEDRGQQGRKVRGALRALVDRNYLNNESACSLHD